MNDAGTAKPTARFASLTGMISPRSVAVLGASGDPTRIGGRPIAYMLKQGFAGAIYPVNPSRPEVQGLRAYAAVSELPEVPDVAVVAVAAKIAVQAVADLAAFGVKNAIVLTAGFAEVDPAGAAEQARMIAIAKAAGMRLLGPNCLGLFNARIGFYPMFSSSFEGGWPTPGRIGVASQSGAYGTHLFAAMRDRGIGTPICVTTGNEGDVTIGDVIGWLAEDPDTDVIAAYAEGIREADSLVAALTAARAARKPVVMMKVGRSALGGAAAKSHTASIAGDDAVTDAVMAEFGVVRARTTEEMMDIAQTATRRIYPVGNTLGVVTVSGGAGVLISDAAELLGLPMPEMPAEAQARLKALIPFSSPRNPVDCTAQVFNDFAVLGQFAGSMVQDGGYKSVLSFFSQVGGAPTVAPKLRAEMKAIRDRHPDRLFVTSVLAPVAMLREYESDGFVVFEDPTRATVAIHAMGRFGDAFAAPAPAAPPSVPQVTLPETTPTEAVAKSLLAELGIPSAPEQACKSADEAVAAAERFGYPVVLKILSPDIMHKSEIGGVLLDVADADAVRAGHALMLERGAAVAGARIEGVLVAKQLKGGVECILGIHRDPVFGPVAMFGLGGIFVEILKDVVFRRCPFGPDVAETMIRSIKAAPLLLGARGRPPADVAALATMLSRLSVFAHQAGPALQSVDLNPVFAMPAGQGAYAADAVIEISKGEQEDA
jgi:acyl-CoA synthetase (NDP forming)